jgi:hypothetical protein
MFCNKLYSHNSLADMPSGSMYSTECTAMPAIALSLHKAQARLQ